MTTEQGRVVVYVEGGVVQCVYVSKGLIGIKVEIIDADNLDDLTRKEIEEQLASMTRGMECVL